MPFRSPIPAALALAACLGLDAPQLAAQQAAESFPSAVASAPPRPDAAYQAGALRLQYRLLGSRLVQGASALVVPRSGFLRPDIPILAAGDDSVRVHYERFRRHAFTAGLVRAFSTTLTVGSLVWYALDTRHRSTASTLGTIGGAVSFGASLPFNRSNDELQQAIWHYNRALATPR